MSLIWPLMLLSLLLVPALAVLYVYTQQRRRRAMTGFGAAWQAQAALTASSVRWRRRLPLALALAGLAILLLALARPQAVVSLPKVEGTIILAFDVSDSMAAQDLKPSRLEAAKAAARDFVQQQPAGVKIGIVVFSDAGFSVQAPTDDQAALLAAIDRLAAERGTSLATGIQISLNTIAQANAIPAPRYYSNATPAATPTPTAMPAGVYSSASIVLLTDGENNINPDPLFAAQEAARRGVRIYTVGAGSPAGTNLQVQGFTVHTQLDETLLKQIASLTGGAYYNAASMPDLRQVYDDIQKQLVVRPEKTEITSILAGAGVLMLVIGGLFSLLWFGRIL